MLKSPKQRAARRIQARFIASFSHAIAFVSARLTLFGAVIVPTTMETLEAPAPAQPAAAPYMSLAISYSQPSALGALAALHGLQAAPAETARVLELGCATGGNLIPLAARFPNARFIGVDLDGRQIETGRARAKAMGLSNIQLRTADIAALSIQNVAFDYIICHGVMSWVSEPVREAIFKICADHLAPHGVAAISFNVLPGWRVQQIVRDLCLHHAGTDGPPDVRVARVRQFLGHVAESASDATPYGLAIRQAAQRLAQRPNSYILGEFLAAENTAFFFHEFAARAHTHGLNYVCDAHLPSSAPEFTHPRKAQLMRKMASGDRARLEGLMDDFSGRTFRRALLTKQPIPAPLQLQPAAVHALHVTSMLTRDTDADPQLAPIFRDAAGQKISVNNPGLAEALDALAQFHPRSMPAADIAAAAGAADAGAARDQIYRDLIQLAGRDCVHFSTSSLRVGAASSERPKAFALAVLEASAGQRWATSLHHRAIGLTEVERSVLAGLDGTRNRADLAALLSDQDAPTAQASIERALHMFEREALLEAES